MATFTVRDVPPEIAQRIRDQADALEISTEEYIRQLLQVAASQVAAKPAYMLRAYDLNNEGASVHIKRDRDGITGRGATNCSEAQFSAYKTAIDLVKRNKPGDRERAIVILRSMFQEVFDS